MLFRLVFISLFILVLSDIKILLLHNNDLFSRFRPVNVRMGYCEEDTSPDCYGGFARIKFAADYKTQEAALKGRHTIFLNAGDTYEGTAYFTFYRWKIVTKMMSMLGFDVIVSILCFLFLLQGERRFTLIKVIDQSELWHYI